MWIDDRGSEILVRNECLRLLSMAAGSVGHLGVIVDGRPIVLPVNYGVADGEVILTIGPGTVFDVVKSHPTVAFEVDQGPDEQLLAWSVLVQGPAEVVEDPENLERRNYWGPHPVVPEPGSAFVRIRPWWMTGRRFRATAPLSVAHGEGASPRRSA